MYDYEAKAKATKSKNKIGLVLILISVLIAILYIGTAVHANFEYENKISYSWNLADKASQIKQKTQYIDKFVSTLESSGLQGKYNAVWLQTPDNSFDKNLEALKSLQSRLHNIQTMDENSLAYQQAIYQITQQEQGEALKMTETFKSIWFKEYHTFLWGWVATIGILLTAVMFIVGLVLALWGKLD
jgi:hypothetical protein